MTARNFLNIILSFVLLLVFIGVPVTKGFCDMEFCKKESAITCCSEAAINNCCHQSTDYIQLDSDFSYIDASVKIPDLALFYVAGLNYLENPVTRLILKHGELSYNIPLLTIDIPVRVRCFRI